MHCKLNMKNNLQLGEVSIHARLVSWALSWTGRDAISSNTEDNPV